MTAPDRHTARHERDAGFSVVELAVASLVLSIILAVMFAAMISVQRATAGADLRLQKLEDARLVAEVLTRDLRTVERDPDSGPGEPIAAFLSASATQVSFYGNLNPNPARGNLPSLITLEVTGTGPRRTLTETVTPPRLVNGEWVRATGTTSETRKRVLTTNLATPSGKLLFEYRSATGAALNTTSSPSVPSSQLGNIAYVRLTITIQTPRTLGSPPTELRTEVRLPNVTVRPE